MTTYVIQKLRHPSLDPHSGDRHTWVEAFGLTEKSWPKVSSDEKAIEHFEVMVSKARSPRRLIKFSGGGYGTYAVVLASAHFPPPPLPSFQKLDDAL
jgi:hypothetical protein